MGSATIRLLVGVTVAGVSLALAGATSAVAVYPAAAAVAPPVLSHWAPAAPVPGLSALTTTSSTVSAVSCAPSADCAIGGTYDDALGNPQAWVASGHAGTWSNAIALPGSITTNGGHSEINGVSCATSNYCVAVGETATSQFADRATVDVDLGGTWQQAMLVPGLGDSSSQALSVSCPSVGNCTVVGWYRDASNARQAFVEDEVNGTWGSFQDVPGIPQLNTGQFAELNSVSCGSPQNCTAAGEFTTLGGTPNAFFAAKVSGSWHGFSIGFVPPTTGRSVSCPASGACVLTGTATDANGHPEVYFMEVTPDGNTVATSLPVFLPGILALNVGGTALDNSVSCPSDGNCVVVGHYTDAAGSGQVLTIDEVNGTWGSPARLPGQTSQGHFSTQSYVSCWSAGNCVTGGVVATPTGLQGIVSVESPAASAALATNTATVKFGQEQSAQLAINVKPKTGGTPAGTVTVKAGQTTVAVVTLKRGKATWTLPPKKLRPGTYQLTGTYTSSNGYNPVTTAKKKLVVTN
jgi:hypothetical protein